MADEARGNKKLHVGCSCIYLTDGWINIDLHSSESGCALAKDNPAGVKRWKTTESDYYGRLQDVDQQRMSKGFGNNHHRDLVCDVYGDFSNLPCDDGDACEVLSRQVFEHLSLREAKNALLECRRVLCDGGIVRLDVPDFEESLEEYRRTGDAFFKRHIIGSKRNHANWHIMGWDRPSLIAFLDEHGFDFVEEEPNIHFYPAFCLKFRKRRNDDLDGPSPETKLWQAAWEYCGSSPGEPLSGEVPDSLYTLEVGSGRAPWPQADVYLDINPEMKQYVPFEAQDEGRFIVADIHNLPLDWTGRFEYALASHVFEHLEDPRQAASELSRIAKQGCVVCPSPWKEGLFVLHELDHKWVAVPTHQKNTLTLVRYDQRMIEGVADEDASKTMHQILRLERKRFGNDGRLMRDWFHRAEPHLDVVVKWSRELKVEIVE